MEYNSEQAIVRALVYSNIFSYPLTKEQLWQYAISEKPLDKKIFFTTLAKSPLLHKKNQFYFLSGQDDLVALRISREKIAVEKLAIARRVSAVLSRIPMICFIGLSGSLAMENTKAEDDIDLFIITQQHTVWVTRLCILFILELLGKRRKKNAIKVVNTICSNLLIEASDSTFPKYLRNLYTAHEIAQVKPLFNRHHMYERFLLANVWIKQFLPHAIERVPVIGESNVIGITLLQKILFPCNFLAKQWQLWYMKRQRTSEIITDTVLAFYTNTMEQQVIKAYKEKLKLYEI